jgi:asparagine synthase (glutamine-hydrolysing)
MKTDFLGGAWLTGSSACDAFGRMDRTENWAGTGPTSHLFVCQRGSSCRLFVWDSLALLIRGYARPLDSTGPLDLDCVAEGLRCHYLEHGELDVDRLAGSFSVALLDAQAGRVVLYRNLVGAGFTYYHVSADRLLFGGNLADLVAAVGETPRPNRDALPAFFLHRFVCGPETLFAGFHRLLPGEQVEWDERGWRRRQRHTFGDLGGAPIRDDEALERLEETMGRVLADCAAHRPETANLLSGGVDSSYLQAMWNRVVAGPDTLPPSYSISVDHPRVWQDTDYAMTASRILGTKHTLVPADGLYFRYLLDTLSATGEPPNHVQSAYFGLLARTMVASGHATGLCGEGADSLFGLGLAGELHAATRMRSLFPLRSLRQLAGSVAGWLGRPRWREACRRADRMDDYADLTHPVNRVASFTEWDLVGDCFGADAVAAAAARRRELLDRFAVAQTPLDRAHGAGFLGEAMDSASLWTTLFNREGGDLLCPFLDSRIIRLALNLSPQVRYRRGQPKDLLKHALVRHASAELAYRTKLGFGQPIFEWLGAGGQLRRLAEKIGPHDFLDSRLRARALARPGWFLSSLLCYDLWHKRFIERGLPDESDLSREACTLAGRSY